MPRYCVTLEETVTYDVIVEAANEDEAGNIAEDVFTNTDVTKLHCVVHDLEVANVEPMAGDCPLTVKMILPAAPPVPPDAPADPVKAEMLAALKRLSGIIRDRHQLHRENIGYALPSLKDAEALIARAEGRA